MCGSVVTSSDVFWAEFLCVIVMKKNTMKWCHERRKHVFLRTVPIAFAARSQNKT